MIESTGSAALPGKYMGRLVSKMVETESLEWHIVRTECLVLSPDVPKGLATPPADVENLV